MCGRVVRGLAGVLSFGLESRLVFDCTPARTYAPASARRLRTFGDRVELLSRHIEEEGGVTGRLECVKKHIPTKGGAHAYRLSQVG